MSWTGLFAVDNDVMEAMTLAFPESEPTSGIRSIGDKR